MRTTALPAGTVLTDEDRVGMSFGIIVEGRAAVSVHGRPRFDRHLPVLQQGRQQAQGVPKTSGPSGVAGSANFPVRNGQTTGTAVADPVGPGSFSCPSGQRPFLDAVSYSNTQITDQFGNTLHATPDPISATVHVAVP